jgi:hypothetical protein
VTDLEARDVEVGFLFADAGAPPRVPKGWRDVIVPGLPVDRIQFFRIGVRRLGAAALDKHVLINAHQSSLTQAACEALGVVVQGAFRSDRVAAVIHDEEGRATALASGPLEDVAFAIAVVKRSCGWDESDPISIHFGAETYHVHLMYQDKEHRGTVVSTSRPTMR